MGNSNGLGLLPFALEINRKLASATVTKHFNLDLKRQPVKLFRVILNRLVR